jgi:hypothetical protein
VPYAEVLVLVAAVGVGVVGAAVPVFGTVTAVLAGEAATGVASAIVVLLPEVAATGTEGVVAAGAGMDAVAAAGVETAGVVTGVGLATANAAVAELESVPPPPPQAATEMAARVERTRKVIVFNEVFMSIYSELRSFGCDFRLFIVGLWNNSILIQNNRFLAE